MGLIAVWSALSGAPAKADEATPELELAGYWYVLLHYREVAEEQPGAAKDEGTSGAWDDMIWHFEPKGARLIWTEYPVALFDDKTGRFETLAQGEKAQTQGFWEPTPAQRVEIAQGLTTRRGQARSKSLRGSARNGYASVGAARSRSTSFIAYSESWKVDGLANLPVFIRDASMGAGRVESIEGRTELRTTEIRARLAPDSQAPDSQVGNAALPPAPLGPALVGHYNRDGNRQGTFQLFRSGALREER